MEPHEMVDTESLIEHMRGFHSCPACFDPDLSNPEIAGRMRDIHEGYHSTNPVGANFGGEAVPHVHERIKAVFNDRRTS